MSSTQFSNVIVIGLPSERVARAGEFVAYDGQRVPAGVEIERDEFGSFEALIGDEWVECFEIPSIDTHAVPAQQWAA